MRRMAVFFLLTGLFLFGNKLLGQVTVQASLDKTDIVIGDQFSASIRITAPQGSKFPAIHYAAWEAAGIELLDIKPILTSSQKPQLLMEQQLKLTSFDTGYHRLPSLEVIYELNGQTDTVFSNALNLYVTALTVQEDAPIRDNKDIIKEARNWRDSLPYALMLLAIIVAIGLFWALAKRQRKPKSSPPPPPIPADEVALKKLAQLEAQALWEKGEIKIFQSELTYIFRAYLENRFGLTALEATTTEITAQLARTNINSEQQITLKKILETADMVKFAKAIPPEGIHKKALDDIRVFVQNTKAKEENKETTA